MDIRIIDEKADKLYSQNGIEVYHIKTCKFKTNTINIFLHDMLSRDRAASNALVPAVLRRGCKGLPALPDISARLEELYGASFDCGVVKKGEYQLVQLYMEHASDKYAGKDARLFDQAFDLLYEILTEPVQENGCFKDEYVMQEKENLKKLIESRVNDKVQYAVERCFELMCQGEPYGVYEYGSVADVEAIKNGQLYKHYITMLETYPISVYITGNIPEESIGKVKEKLGHIRRGSVKQLGRPSIDPQSGEVKTFEEQMSVSQGKLSMGFRTNTAPDDPGYYALLVYNGILGGGIHSKLFQNVREKHSLAYYAFSRLDKFKGLMVISSGIEMQNKDKAKKIILEQLEEIKNGNISDYEFEATLKTYETGLKSLKDSQLQIVDFYLSQAIAGTGDSFDDVIAKVKKVTRQDVINIAGRIGLDTVYFLSGGRQQEEGSDSNGL